MFKVLVPGALAVATLAGPAVAAPTPAPAAAWMVTPAQADCSTELELVGRSGGVTPVTLVSDGRLLVLRVAKEGLAERAFLPIRIDQKRYSNLMLRGADGRGELVLSEETEAALRKGTTLAIAWLGEEPVSIPLSGSEQGVSDLKVCGAQMASQAEARARADAEAKAKADADARVAALAQAQIEAARAQTAAAEAERLRVEEAAERQRRQEAEVREREYAEARQREYAEQRQRAYDAEAARRRAYEQDAVQPWLPPARPAYPAWGYRRY